MLVNGKISSHQFASLTVSLLFLSLLYVVALGVAQTLNSKDYRFLAFPLGMIMVVLSIVVYESIVNFIEFTPRICSVYAMTYMLFLPLLLLGIDTIRKKRFK